MSIDILIVLGFLIATFIVGIGQSSSIKNIKEYALGRRDFSTGALVSTLVATWIGGGTFTTELAKTYTDGLYFIIASLGMPLCFIIMAYVFIPKMHNFLGKTSIAETMGDLYGNTVRIILAVTGIIAITGGIAVQFKVFGNIASYFLDFTAFEGILIAAFIVTSYSAFGGIKAVTFTDILQACTFGLAIPIIGVMIWNQNYNEGLSFANSLQEPKFNFSTVLDFENPGILPMITLMLYYALPGMGPEVVQRISMGSSIAQVKRAFIISAGLVLFITFGIKWISFLLFNVNSNLEQNNLFGYIIENYTYTGFKGVVMAGVVAMAMSSADSFINTASVLFANDFCKPLNIGKNNELLLSKIFALFLGVSSVILATSAKDLLDIVLTANSFYMPVVTVPVMLTIWGFRTSKKSILIGMFAGFITVIIWELLEIQADGIVFAMLINSIFLLSSHYFLKQPGGWIGYNKAPMTTARTMVKTEKDFSWPIFCKKYGPKDELTYIGLGIYLVVYTITSMYSTQAELGKENNQIILTIYQMMLISGVAFLMYPVWPASISRKTKDKIAQVLWPIVIFYMLVLFNVFLILVSDFIPLQFAVFTVNLLITSMLLGWRISIVMIAAGVFLALKLHDIYDPYYSFDVYLGSPGFIVTYTLLLIGSTIMIFVKPKQDHLEATEAENNNLKMEITHLDHEVGNLHNQVDNYSKKISDQKKEIERLGTTAQQILDNVNCDLRLPVGNVMNFSEMLYKGLGKHSPETLKELSDQVYKNSTLLSSIILNILDLANLEVKKANLDKTLVNFSEIVKNRVTTCRNVYLQGKPINFKLMIDPEIMIYVDPNYMRQAIDNLVINSINFSEDGTIIVKLEKLESYVQFTIIDQGISIAEEDISDLFKPFTTSSNDELKPEGRGVGLSLCKSIIEAHEGKISAENNGKGAIFRFVLPLT